MVKPTTHDCEMLEYWTSKILPDGSTSKSNILTEINYNKSSHKYGRKNYCRTTKITKK